LYKDIPQQIFTATINQPSEKQFEHLHGIYDDSFQCSSSRISIEYVSITKISYSMHHICTSDSLKKNFTDYLFDKIVLPLAQGDFRFHAISFFHLLVILCLLTQEVLTNSRIEFPRAPLINIRVLSR